MRDERTAELPFDLERFLPYLLTQAAGMTGRSFSTVYRREFGMTQTQWRVMANLGKFGAMSAADICRLAHTEKTKVSRAVAALEGMGLLRRSRSDSDRRRENLSLTTEGQRALAHLGKLAEAYDRGLRARIGEDRARALETALRALIVPPASERGNRYGGQDRGAAPDFIDADEHVRRKK